MTTQLVTPKSTTPAHILNSDAWYNMQTALLECSVQENIDIADLGIKYRADKNQLRLIRKSTRQIMFIISL